MPQDETREPVGNPAHNPTGMLVLVLMLVFVVIPIAAWFARSPT